MRNQCFAFFESKDDASDICRRSSGGKGGEYSTKWQYGYGAQDNQV